MRKWNAVISVIMMVLFLAHAIVGAFELMGIYSGLNKAASILGWILVPCIAAHVIIGIKLTYDTIKACRKSGVSYFRENRLFWTRRISGFVIVLFMVIHIILFMGHSSGGAYRLNYFGSVELITQICLVLSIALHVLSNVKPSLISFGIPKLKEYAADILLVMVILLAFTGLGFIIYYCRWR